MSKQEIINDILEIEWVMFHTVNGEKRVSCQEDKTRFDNLRTAQYIVWSEEALASYYKDLKACEDAGWNIAREKYIRMMKVSDPVNYSKLKGELAPVTPEKERLVEEIWKIALPQTIKFRTEFPKVSTGGRPLTIAEEKGYPSVENYQKSELMTYSEETLRLLLEHIKKMEAEGKEFFRIVQDNSVKCMGFESMEDAERKLS